jgi:hypothetical protein
MTDFELFMKNTLRNTSKKCYTGRKGRYQKPFLHDKITPFQLLHHTFAE